MLSPEALRQLALLCRTTGCGWRARWSVTRSLRPPLALRRRGGHRCSWRRRRRRGLRQPVSSAVGGDALEELGAEALRGGARDAGQRGERVERCGPLQGEPTQRARPHRGWRWQPRSRREGCGPWYGRQSAAGMTMASVPRLPACACACVCACACCSGCGETTARGSAQNLAFLSRPCCWSSGY